ncbi:MAG: DUF4235 domain-containing protein [Jatrophihabitantaceae bacterium]
MANAAGKIGMKVLTIVVGIPVVRVTKKLVARTWVAARPEDPPHTSKDRDAKWSDAIGFAALSAVGVVAAELLTRKGAETAWRQLTGSEPPPPPPTKVEKKLAKAAAKKRKKDEQQAGQPVKTKGPGKATVSA